MHPAYEPFAARAAVAAPHVPRISAAEGGSTHAVLEPLTLIARLCALVPHPFKKLATIFEYPVLDVPRHHDLEP